MTSSATRSPTAQPPLRLGGVPEHFNLPWHLAMESGDLDPVGVTWSDQTGGTGQMIQALDKGELDVVSILTEGTVSAINRGLQATIIGTYVQSPLSWGVFVPADSPFETEADLEGRRVAISRFTSGSHLMAFIQADRHGWQLDDSQFVVTGGLEGTRQSFANGSSDQLLWDQFMTRPLVDSGEFRQIGVQETPWPSFVFAASNAALTGRTTDVGRVVDAVVAQATALHDRTNIVQEIVTRYRLPANTARAWLESVSFAQRGPADPALPFLVLAELAQAGFR